MVVNLDQNPNGLITPTQWCPMFYVLPKMDPVPRVSGGQNKLHLDVVLPWFLFHHWAMCAWSITLSVLSHRNASAVWL